MKNKLDLKLVNLALITLILFLIYQMYEFWGGFLIKIWTVLMPFAIAFILAYILYPVLKFLQNKGLPKPLALIIVLLTLGSILSILGLLVIPLLIEQLSSLFNNIILFVREFSTKHDLQFGPLQESLTTTFNSIIITLGNYVSDGAINIINMSLNVITNVLIILSVSIYFLIDMDNIWDWFKNYLSTKNPKTYLYFVMLDEEMKSYLTGISKIMCITFFEYTIAYSLIKHPNALLLGLLASLSNMIPFFGAMIVNIIALITSAVNLPFPGLFIKTFIAIAIISIADTYVINPNVFKRSNRIHPIIIILSVFAGGYLFGVIGIFLSLPFSIMLITIYKFYKTDIHSKINDIKEKTTKKNIKKSN